MESVGKNSCSIPKKSLEQDQHPTYIQSSKLSESHSSSFRFFFFFSFFSFFSFLSLSFFLCPGGGGGVARDAMKPLGSGPLVKGSSKFTGAVCRELPEMPTPGIGGPICVMSVLRCASWAIGEGEGVRGGCQCEPGLLLNSTGFTGFRPLSRMAEDGRLFGVALLILLALASPATMSSPTKALSSGPAERSLSSKALARSKAPLSGVLCCCS